MLEIDIYNRGENTQQQHPLHELVIYANGSSSSSFPKPSLSGSSGST